MMLSGDIPVECYRESKELHRQLDCDLFKFKNWFTSILGIRNGKVDNLWVRKGSSNKFILCHMKKEWEGEPHQTISFTLKVNSAYSQSLNEDSCLMSQNDLLVMIEQRLYRTLKGDLAVYVLFNPMDGGLRIVTAFDEILDQRQKSLEKNLAFIEKLLRILANFHGSIRIFQPPEAST
ncbi:MAG TPA: hypothetical protein O0X27_07080 [Methanocorpusculum sp.]|nr:hypothetical protein [Methanocorpusculum sp.]